MLKYSVYIFCLLLLAGSLEVKGEEDRKVKLRNLQKIKEDEKDFESNVQLSEPDAEGHMKISGDFKHHVTLDNDWKVSHTSICYKTFFRQ